MTFSGVSNDLVSLNSYTESGITATSVDGSFWGFPSGAQLHLDPDSFGNSTFDFTFSGGAFDLVGFDISDTGFGSVGTLTGYDAMNNVVATNIFAGDTLGTLTFEGFNSISRLRLVDTVNHFSIDNLVLNAAAAVPEPSTWAMMLFGFGMVGASMRYRRRSTTTVYA